MSEPITAYILCAGTFDVLPYQVEMLRRHLPNRSNIVAVVGPYTEGPLGAGPTKLDLAKAAGVSAVVVPAAFAGVRSPERAELILEWLLAENEEIDPGHRFRLFLRSGVIPIGPILDSMLRGRVAAFCRAPAGVPWWLLIDTWAPLPQSVGDILLAGAEYHPSRFRGGAGRAKLGPDWLMVEPCFAGRHIGRLPGDAILGQLEALAGCRLGSWGIVTEPEDWATPNRDAIVEPAEMPGLAARFGRWGRAVLRWIAAGCPTRSEEEIKRLYQDHCAKCAHVTEDGHACRSCGCMLSPRKGSAIRNKLAMETEGCPEGFFTAAPPFQSVDP